jgi:hypothetical protein
VSTDEDALDRLPSVPEAEFNSISRQDRPDCLDGTRSALLESIDKWVETDDTSCVFWLNGWAGTGKSAVAQTVARRYSKRKQLGASFFFSRGGGDAGHARKFFTSIARQLAIANVSPGIQQHICAAAKAHRHIASHSFEDQWNRLVLEPLYNTASCTIVVVVDALDECVGETDIKILLRLLTQAGSLPKTHLRIFLTSRPDVPVQHGFKQSSPSGYSQYVLHNIESHIVEHDIKLFLEHEFRQMSGNFDFAIGWPGDETKSALLQQACGLFIWVATACRFISEGTSTLARARLEEISSHDGKSSEPADRLDEIYITVLHSAINQPGWRQREKEEMTRTLLKILGPLILLYSTLPLKSFANLLGTTDRWRIKSTLSHLHSILDIPTDHLRAIRLHHPSFRDFLLSRDRCGESGFWVNEEETHTALLKASLRIMNGALKMDICQHGTPGVLVSDIDESQIQRLLPPELHYACLYWTSHCKGKDQQLLDDGAIHNFLREHILHWLEAMSWMGKTSEAIASMALLELLTEVRRLIRNMDRLVVPQKPEANVQLERWMQELTHSHPRFPKVSDVRKIWYRAGTTADVCLGCVVFAIEKCCTGNSWKDDTC